ncbi:hypothetical protein ACQKWADRAFT_292795 [Trichoderma austrokoningii]
MLADTIRPYVASSSRVFGTLLYAPEAAFAPLQIDGRGHGQWLRDWALIEPLPSRHQASLGTLTNKVFIERVNIIEDILDGNKEGWAGLPEPKPVLAIDGVVTLTNHHVPTSELLNHGHYTDYNDEPVTFVVEFGAGDYIAGVGLTIGLGNTLKSIVHVNDAVEGHMKGNSEEWAIISATWNGDRQSSHRGSVLPRPEPSLKQRLHARPARAIPPTCFQSC